MSEALGAEPGVEIEQKIVEGDAGDALVAESESAELVVVGSHGRTGLKAALLGSVSRHVVSHAACPVVVVKPPAVADHVASRPRSGRLRANGIRDRASQS